MSASLSQKSQTKLKTFLKEKEKPAKRFKSLVSFIGTPPRQCSALYLLISYPITSHFFFIIRIMNVPMCRERNQGGAQGVLR